MSAIAAEVEKAVAELRPLQDATIWVRYVNEHGVLVKRRVRIDAERVDGAAVQGAA